MDGGARPWRPRQRRRVTVTRPGSGPTPGGTGRPPPRPAARRKSPAQRNTHTHTGARARTRRSLQAMPATLRDRRMVLCPPHTTPYWQRAAQARGRKTSLNRTTGPRPSPASSPAHLARRVPNHLLELGLPDGVVVHELVDHLHSNRSRNRAAQHLSATGSTAWAPTRARPRSSSSAAAAHRRSFAAQGIPGSRCAQPHCACSDSAPRDALEGMRCRPPNAHPQATCPGPGRRRAMRPHLAHRRPSCLAHLSISCVLLPACPPSANRPSHSPPPPPTDPHLVEHLCVLAAARPPPSPTAPCPAPQRTHNTPHLVEHLCMLAGVPPHAPPQFHSPHNAHTTHLTWLSTSACLPACRRTPMASYMTITLKESATANTGLPRPCDSAMAVVTPCGHTRHATPRHATVWHRTSPP